MKIVYLHGVGDGDPEQTWLRGLNVGLTQHGSSEVSPDDVIAPRYAGLLTTQGIKAKHPKRTYNDRNDHDARRAFERRQARVQRSLGKSGVVRTFGLGRVPDAVLEKFQKSGVDWLPILRQVKNYMENEDLRAAILQQILDDLPTSGDVILIGHSLGSVIAIDLLDHLPPNLHVRRFITIGSPGGSSSLHRGSDRILKRFPYSKVDDWSNFLDVYDPVTSGRGLTGIFPGAQDFGIGDAWQHRSDLYLKHPAIAALVSDTLHPSTDLVPSDSGIVLRLEDTDATTLLTLAYARRVGALLDGEQKLRYEDALAVLQDGFAQALLEQGDGRQLPPELAQLARGQMPALPRRWDLPDAVGQATVLAFTNVLDPYEVDAGPARFDAIPDLFVDLGWPSHTGHKVKDAIKEVAEAVAAERRGLSTRTKVVAAAAGLALLAAGPIGIAMAGAAGAAGAAAITSGLAAFGPGGMVGGLATLGSLASTGAMVTTVAATARGGLQPLLVDPTSVAIQVAIAHALNTINEPYDHDLWYRLTAAESEIGAELNRLTPFSDEKAPSLIRLGAALKTISDLMDFMLQHNLTPPGLPSPANT
ncbi:alpha/beta hydrolase [Gordonia polyisoprenivorans]|uniref:alpha/beta hydrolase n=1 Tax=Gordonia polyisoprenivorans TaxID=84595 RepID=UPI000B99E2BF|nr:alpha/beta hydrolase [Gordonia polyisoprenivorans]OZC29682.1 hypothetical protein CJJ17_23645 [Gordonia polyisoprenivorans]